MSRVHYRFTSGPATPATIPNDNHADRLQIISAVTMALNGLGHSGVLFLSIVNMCIDAGIRFDITLPLQRGGFIEACTGIIVEIANIFPELDIPQKVDFLSVDVSEQARKAYVTFVNSVTARTTKYNPEHYVERDTNVVDPLTNNFVSTRISADPSSILNTLGTKGLKSLIPPHNVKYQIEYRKIPQPPTPGPFGLSHLYPHRYVVPDWNPDKECKGDHSKIPAIYPMDICLVALRGGFNVEFPTNFAPHQVNPQAIYVANVGATERIEAGKVKLNIEGTKLSEPEYKKSYGSYVENYKLITCEECIRRISKCDGYRFIVNYLDVFEREIQHMSNIDILLKFHALFYALFFYRELKTNCKSMLLQVCKLNPKELLEDIVVKTEIFLRYSLMFWISEETKPLLSKTSGSIIWYKSLMGLIAPQDVRAKPHKWYNLFHYAKTALSVRSIITYPGVLFDHNDIVANLRSEGYSDLANRIVIQYRTGSETDISEQKKEEYPHLRVDNPTSYPKPNLGPGAPNTMYNIGPTGPTLPFTRIVYPPNRINERILDSPDEPPLDRKPPYTTTVGGDTTEHGGDISRIMNKLEAEDAVDLDKWPMFSRNSLVGKIHYDIYLIDLYIMMQAVQYLRTLCYTFNYDDISISTETLPKVLSQIDDILKSFFSEWRREKAITLQSIKDLWTVSYPWYKELRDVFTPVLGRYKPNFLKVRVAHNELAPRDEVHAIKVKT